MIRTKDAIAEARALLGTPYAQLDCINLIKKVIRDCPGGEAAYTTAGTNALWDSYGASAKYRDLTWRQEGTAGARAGMLAFKRSGADVHHVGLVTEAGTVVHASSVRGETVETVLDGTWHLLAAHRYIEVAAEENNCPTGWAVVATQRDPLRVRTWPETGEVLGSIPKGAMVEVLEDTGDGWLRIRQGALEGYASGAYLRQMDGEVEADRAAHTTLEDEKGQRLTLQGAWRVIETTDGTEKEETVCGTE